MTTLAHDIPKTAHWRLGIWAARAWNRMGWRHVLLALVLSEASALLRPLGGILLTPDGLPTYGIENLLNGSWFVGWVPIVYSVLIADEAFNDGVPPLRAYGLAVIALAALGPVVLWHFQGFMGYPRNEAPQMLWMGLAYLFQGGLGMSIYAYWRVTQRAMRRAQAAETERARSEQRVHTARLLAMQSRVEPQLLFDALGRVGSLHVHEPQAADALLADLIALLRAMLPGAKADNSTVEREFALVDAWLHVARDAGHGAARVQLRIAPEARSTGIAPMLVLPLLRALLTVPGAAQCEWVLSARVAGERLLVTLQPDGHAAAEAAGLLASTDLSSLRQRLLQLFAGSAQLAASARPPALTLDLPSLQEESHDDRADR
jgi:hypothetical protein